MSVQTDRGANRRLIRLLGLTANFGAADRFSVFAAVGFNAVLGLYLFCGFRNGQQNASS